MATRPTNRSLIIPGKNYVGAHDGYQKDMQTLEIWGRQPIQRLIAGSGITLSPSSGLATDAKGNGPNPITISASGGGGGITTVASPLGSITVTNPTGPTVDVDVSTYPFLQWGGHNSVAYGPGTYASGSATATDDVAVGFDALNSVTSGHDDTVVGYEAGWNITSGFDNTLYGSEAGHSLTTSFGNTLIGKNAGLSLNSTENTCVGRFAGDAIVSGFDNLIIGAEAQSLGQSAPDQNYLTILAVAGVAHADGCVVIGMDHLGHQAVAHNQDDFVLGTSAHIVNFLNNQVGSATLSLGTGNAPGSGGAPSTFIVIRDNSGSIGYIPVWH